MKLSLLMASCAFASQFVDKVPQYLVFVDNSRAVSMAILQAAKVSQLAKYKHNFFYKVSAAFSFVHLLLARSDKLRKVILLLEDVLCSTERRFEDEFFREAPDKHFKTISSNTWGIIKEPER